MCASSTYRVHDALDLVKVLLVACKASEELELELQGPDLCE